MGRGRKKIEDDKRKVRATFRLTPTLLDWMRKQELSQAKLIEKAMKKTYGVE